MTLCFNKSWCAREHRDIKTRFSHRCCAVIHPERFLHVGAQQDLSSTDGSTVQVLQDTNRSALVEVPVKLVWSDLSSISYDIKQKQFLMIGQYMLLLSSRKVT